MGTLEPRDGGPGTRLNIDTPDYIRAEFKKQENRQINKQQQHPSDLILSHTYPRWSGNRRNYHVSFFQGVELAKMFEKFVRKDSRFEIPAERTLGLVVFRLKVKRM